MPFRRTLRRPRRDPLSFAYPPRHVAIGDIERGIQLQRLLEILDRLVDFAGRGEVAAEVVGRAWDCWGPLAGRSPAQRPASGFV